MEEGRTRRNDPRRSLRKLGWEFWSTFGGSRISITGTTFSALECNLLGLGMQGWGVNSIFILVGWNGVLQVRRLGLGLVGTYLIGGNPYTSMIGWDFHYRWAKISSVSSFWGSVTKTGPFVFQIASEVERTSILTRRPRRESFKGRTLRSGSGPDNRESLRIGSIENILRSR